MGVKLGAVLLFAAAAGQPSPGNAQNPVGVPDRPFVVIGRRDLLFGTVLPGIPTSVRSNDPRFSGEFEIQGTAGASVRVEFSLPALLVTPGGATLPISFATDDGSYAFHRGLPHRSIFDPHVPVVAALGPNGKLHVWLGGTVSPVPGQTGGAYVAAISITVFNLGI
jgi:hypothetical protein